MKKIFDAALALLLISSCGLAEESAIPGTLGISEDAVTTVDLDQDGTEESITMQYNEGYWELTVTSATASDTFRAGLIWGNAGCIDLNGDGTQEILLWGDWASSDYYTYCLEWTGEILYPFPFADVDRGERHDGAYAKCGYGAITDISEDGTLTLACTQDVMCSFQASRRLKLINGYFETCDDGYWMRTQEDLEAAVSGENGDSYIVAKVEVPCVYFDEDGTESEGTLQPGDRFLVTGTDKKWSVLFLTEDGRNGELQCSCSDFTIYMNGSTGDELFDNMMYYD